jgi:hypothetical protein
MVNGYPILSPPRVRAQAIVDLISRLQRPFLFKVTVWAVDFPEQRIYEIAALSDNDAALQGLRQFQFDMALRERH